MTHGQGIGQEKERKQGMRAGILAVVGMVVLSGCASLKNGAYEKVEIVSNPAGAYCEIYREGQGLLKAIATPGAKYIKRGKEPVQIVCSKKGYETVAVEIAPTKDKIAVGNMIANVGVGLIVDSASGAIYELPDKIELSLKRL